MKNNKYIQAFIALASVFFLFTACNKGNHNYDVDKIVRFVEVQKDSSIYYSDTNWDTINIRYRKLLEEANKYKDELTLGEKNRIAKASITYIFLQSHRGKKQIKDVFNK